MEEVRVDDYRINVVDDFVLPNELVELRKDSIILTGTHLKLISTKGKEFCSV